MIRSLLFSSTLALLCIATSAHADLIPAPTAEWSYDFEPTDNAVFADGPLEQHETSGVSFTNEASRDVIGSSDIVVTNLRTFSLTPADNPALLGSNGAYEFTVTLTDIESGLSATRTLTGKLGGDFSQDNANVTNEFTGDTSFTIPLGPFVYELTLTTYSPPGPPSAANAGSITAHVDVFTEEVTVAHAPEPSTMALSFMGLSLVGGAAWRRRRRQVAKK